MEWRRSVFDLSALVIYHYTRSYLYFLEWRVKCSLVRNFWLSIEFWKAFIKVFNLKSIFITPSIYSKSSMFYSMTRTSFQSNTLKSVCDRLMITWSGDYWPMAPCSLYQFENPQKIWPRNCFWSNFVVLLWSNGLIIRVAVRFVTYGIINFLQFVVFSKY